MHPDSQKTPLAAHTPESARSVFANAGLAPYRADQVFDWFYRKGARDFRAMKNVGAPVVRFLEEYFTPLSSALVARHDAGDGAVKLDIELADGAGVEAVVIKTPRRVTLCLSSQSGCPLSCAFCATGAGGFERNLAPHEIVEQALHASDVLGAPRRISHAVFMGMGEPCLNLDAVLDAVDVLNAPWAFGIGARRITISTLGFPGCLERLAAFPLEIGVAISLHAATDALRKKLAPLAPAAVSETVEAAWRYFEKTGREVTYEYVLLAGVNDGIGEAAALAAALSGKRAYVNLIPYNEVEGLPFRRPTPARVIGFRRALQTRGIKVHVRDSRGSGAKAACGQLRFEGTRGAPR